MSTMAVEEPVLELESIRKYFAARHRWHKGARASDLQVVKAVDDVSLRVLPRETLGLVGESGCGKTTLGRVAAAR